MHTLRRPADAGARTGGGGCARRRPQRRLWHGPRRPGHPGDPALDRITPGNLPREIFISQGVACCQRLAVMSQVSAPARASPTPPSRCCTLTVPVPTKSPQNGITDPLRRRALRPRRQPWHGLVDRAHPCALLLPSRPKKNERPVRSRTSDLLLLLCALWCPKP